MASSFHLPELSSPMALGTHLSFTVTDPSDEDDMGFVEVVRDGKAWMVSIVPPGSEASSTSRHSTWPKVVAAVQRVLERFHRRGFGVERTWGPVDEMQIARRNASEAVKSANAAMRKKYGNAWYDRAGAKAERDALLHGKAPAAKAPAQRKAPRKAPAARKTSAPVHSDASRFSAAGIKLDAFHFGKKVGTFTWSNGVATLKRRGHPAESHEIDKAGAFYWMDMMRSESFDFRTPDEGAGLAVAKPKPRAASGQTSSRSSSAHPRGWEVGSILLVSTTAISTWYNFVKVIGSTPSGKSLRVRMLENVERGGQAFGDTIYKLPGKAFRGDRRSMDGASEFTIPMPKPGQERVSRGRWTSFKPWDGKEVAEYPYMD